MLNAYACEFGRLVVLPQENAERAVWFDMEHPTPEETAFVARVTGLELPTHEELTEIETSSRLYAEGDVLTLSLPIVTRVQGALEDSVCGFVLAPDRLVTLRFNPSIVFAQFPAQSHAVGEHAPAYLFAGLIEAIVGRQADALESLKAGLDGISHRIFRTRLNQAKGGKQQRYVEAELQTVLFTLGRDYDVISSLRDSLLGVARIVPYVLSTASWLPEPVQHRLRPVTHDVTSLTDFAIHLSDKVQFLLDSTLGLINISQNTLIKVLTIVSIVGIPPTLIAGIYGMNFVNIPELHWDFGYAYAWAIMVLSAVAPLFWFRKKGWL
jgi:magnesium transporter